MRQYGMFLSVFHNVQICQTGGISLEEYITCWANRASTKKNGSVKKSSWEIIQETSASLEFWGGVTKQIASHAEDSHIHAKFPKLAARLLQYATDAGCGREEVSALFASYS